ncbi:MAG: hypothetical protein AAGA76_13470 [Pseudomonadota bacterium]
MAQEQSQNTNNLLKYHENFDSEDKTLMLGGQIGFKNPKSKWLVYIAEGKLVFENRLEPQSLHWDDIQWIRYPDTEVLTSTENAVISATVNISGEGLGGAGILVGSGKRGAYWVFGVDEQGRYHLFNKAGRNANTAHSAKHAAIFAGQPNRLTYEMRGDNIAFFANDTEIIQVPNGKSKLHSRTTTGQTGVGLAAFGLGTYTFDEVQITQAK